MRKLLTCGGFDGGGVTWWNASISVTIFHPFKKKNKSAGTSHPKWVSRYHTSVLKLFFDWKWRIIFLFFFLLLHDVHTHIPSVKLHTRKITAKKSHPHLSPFKCPFSRQTCFNRKATKKDKVAVPPQKYKKKKKDIQDEVKHFVTFFSFLEKKCVNETNAFLRTIL